MKKILLATAMTVAAFSCSAHASSCDIDKEFLSKATEKSQNTRDLEEKTPIICEQILELDNVDHVRWSLGTDSAWFTIIPRVYDEYMLKALAKKVCYNALMSYRAGTEVRVGFPDPRDVLASKNPYGVVPITIRDWYSCKDMWG